MKFRDRLLDKAGALRSLILELLIGTEAASSLVPEFTALMKNSAVDCNTRQLALEVLLSAPGYNPANDCADLLAEGSPDALELASRAVTKRGVATIGTPSVSALLVALSGLYPEPNTRHQDGMARYFIEMLVRNG